MLILGVVWVVILWQVLFMGLLASTSEINDETSHGIAFDSPDLTAIVDTTSGQFQLEAFKWTRNDRILEQLSSDKAVTSAITQLGWVSIGHASFVRTADPKNQSEVKIFHETDDGFSTYIQMLSPEQKQVLAAAAYTKYHLKVEDNQIFNLVLSKFECSRKLYDKTGNTFLLKGEVSDFHHFPLRMDFETPPGSTERRLFEIELKKESYHKFNCRLLSHGKVVKTKTLTITPYQQQLIGLEEKLFGSPSTITSVQEMGEMETDAHVTEDQTRALAKERRTSLSIFEEYEMPEVEFSSSPTVSNSPEKRKITTDEYVTRSQTAELETKRRSTSLELLEDDTFSKEQLSLSLTKTQEMRETETDGYVTKDQTGELAKVRTTPLSISGEYERSEKQITSSTIEITNVSKARKITTDELVTRNQTTELEKTRNTSLNILEDTTIPKVQSSSSLTITSAPNMPLITNAGQVTRNQTSTVSEEKNTSMNNLDDHTIPEGQLGSSLTITRDPNMPMISTVGQVTTGTETAELTNERNKSSHNLGHYTISNVQTSSFLPTTSTPNIPTISTAKQVNERNTYRHTLEDSEISAGQLSSPSSITRTPEIREITTDVYVTRDQMVELANEMYTSLNILEEYEMPEVQFSEAFANDLINQISVCNFSHVPVDEALSSLSKYGFDIPEDFQPDVVKRHLESLFFIQSLGDESRIVLDQQRYSEFFNPSSGSNEGNGALDLGIGIPLLFNMNLASLPMYANTSNGTSDSISLSDQLRHLNTHTQTEVIWEIEGNRIVPKSLNVARLTRSKLRHTLSFSRVRVQTITALFDRQFSVYPYRSLPGTQVLQDVKSEISNLRNSISSLSTAVKELQRTLTPDSLEGKQQRINSRQAFYPMSVVDTQASTINSEVFDSTSVVYRRALMINSKV